MTRSFPYVLGISAAAVFILSLGTASTARAQAAVRIDGVALPDTARTILSEILREAGVRSARVTSTDRSPEDQVRIMHGYIQRHGAAGAKQLYGPEGDAVVDVYVQNRNRPREEVLAAMLNELHRQLPSALANNRLMHLHPCFYTFDVSMWSIPEARRDDFIRAAQAHPGVHRFLGPEQGEREAYHIEVARPGECPVEYRSPQGRPSPGEGGG